MSPLASPRTLQRLRSLTDSLNPITSEEPNPELTEAILNSGFSSHMQFASTAARSPGLPSSEQPLPQPLSQAPSEQLGVRSHPGAFTATQIPRSPTVPAARRPSFHASTSQQAGTPGAPSALHAGSAHSHSSTRSGGVESRSQGAPREGEEVHSPPLSPSARCTCGRLTLQWGKWLTCVISLRVGWSG